MRTDLPQLTRRSAFHPLPLGAIQPSGWLRRQLELQATGLTGALEDIWPDVGPKSAWLGGDGEDWERGPYYADGLVPLAHLLRDNRLIERANRWTDAMLLSQGDDGQFGPRTNLDWWPRMVALKVLTQHFEATLDSRVLPFMERYFRYQLAELPNRPLDEWGKARASENLLSVAWLLRRNPEPGLLELADLLLAQGTDWGARLADDPPRGFTRAWDPTRHVVNVAMGLKMPAVRLLFDGDDRHKEILGRALRNIERYHGQVTGMFSGDEWLAGRGPSHGVELCAVAEYMFTLETLAAVLGDAEYGDLLEQVTFNAFASTITADMRAHQYLQQPNQVACTIAPRRWTYNSDEANIFGLEPNFGCCTANLHQGWPKFTASLWMQTLNGGLAAISYAPCKVQTPTQALEIETDYPFSDRINIGVRLKRPMSFALHLRIPAWCNEPCLVIEGKPIEIVTNNGFALVDREWHDGESVQLVLPSKPRTIHRSSGSAGVGLGPLLLVLPVVENWRPLPDRPGLGDWEIYPTSPWNYGLTQKAIDGLSGNPISRGAVSSMPFGSPAVGVPVETVEVDNWKLQQNSAGPIPSHPIPSSDPINPTVLVPYGTARLRIAEFPIVSDDEVQRPLVSPAQACEKDQ
jgi:uncharacterized protein